MNPVFRIEMLGGLRVYSEGRSDRPATRFATAKTASLLAFLALHSRRFHPREELVERFWPEVFPSAGRASLRVALASLRRQMEPPGMPSGTLLIADRNNIRLNPGAFTTDVVDFEDAVRQGNNSRARDLYCGDFLPGFYDDWVLEERDRLSAQYEEITESASAQEDLELHETHSDTSAAPQSQPMRVSAPHLTSRIPMVFTRCFGRDQDIEAVLTLLGRDRANRRLVTLTGTGGIGKTRMAIEIADAAEAVFGSAVFFTTLADIRDKAIIASHTARSLALNTAASKITDPLDQIVEHLRSYSRSLLVLDNLEHLMDQGGTAFVLTLLSRVPTLSILATSRRRLHLADEREWPVSPLPLPQEEQVIVSSQGSLAAENALRNPAVQLFVDRAQAARSDFQITARNAASVTAICRRLDGLPLALELAAARAQSLTAKQMLQGLEKSASYRSGLVETRRRERGERHRSLHAAIAWSIDLLPTDLASFWARLSVFRGGCTAEAAQAVTREPEAGEYLTQLRERSLLIAEEAGDTFRYRMLETLREFAAEMMPRETETLRQRSAVYFVEWAERALFEPESLEAAENLRLVDRDYENLRAALTWCGEKDAASDSESRRSLGLQLSGALWSYWQPRGLLREGRDWLRLFLPAGEIIDGSFAKDEVAILHYGRALRAAGTLALRQADYSDARCCFKQSLALWRRAGNENRVADALNNLGGVENREGNYPAARRFLSEGLAVLRKLGDKRGISSALNNLGTVTHFLGDSATAVALYEESLALKREIGEKGSIAVALNNAALVSLHLDDVGKAGRFAAEALDQVRESGDLTAIADLLETFSQIAGKAQEPESAVMLAGAAQQLRERIGAPLTAADQLSFNQHIERLQAALGKRKFQSAFQRGKEMETDEVMETLRSASFTPAFSLSDQV